MTKLTPTDIEKQIEQGRDICLRMLKEMCDKFSGNPKLPVQNVLSQAICRGEELAAEKALKEPHLFDEIYDELASERFDLSRCSAWSSEVFGVCITIAELRNQLSTGCDARKH